MPCTLSTLWSVRRLELVRSLKTGAVAPHGATADDILRLCEEGLYARRENMIQITPAGSLLKTLDVMASKEGGPWSLAEIHQSKPQMSTKQIEVSLLFLSQQDIVKSVPGKRGTKWDLKVK